MSPPGLAGLPSALLALAGALEAGEVLPDGLPEERRADCGACPMAAPPGAPPDRDRPFRHGLRCCTFHPRVPNFLLGAALDRGGVGEAGVMARLEDPDGVSAMGIEQGAAAREHYEAVVTRGFGIDPGLLCPYWAGGELACGIWMDRAAACRSWHCRYQDGPRGRAVWQRAQGVLELAELLLAQRCVDAGGAPEEGAGAAVMAGWYQGCAARVAAMTREEALALREPLLEELEAALAGADAARRAPLPAVLTPAVKGFERRGERVRLRGDAGFDPVDAPMGVFALIARLDGRPWREALAGANGELDEALPEALVARLWQAGVLVGGGGSTVE